MKRNPVLLIISFTLPQFIIFLFQLYFRKTLPVEFFGIWAFLLVIIQYLSYSFTPIRTTIDWKGPVLIEDSQLNEKMELIGTSLITMFITSLILIAFSSIYFFNIYHGGKIIFYIAFCSVLIFQRGFKGYFEMIFRNERLYKLISVLRLVFDIGTPIIQFILVIFYGWKGYLYGFIIIGLSYMVIMFINFIKRINFKFSFNRGHLIDIYKIGGIILASSLLTNVFFTVDQLFIKYFLGTKELGVYSFSVLFMDKALLIGSPLLMIFQPDFYEWYKRAKDTANIEISKVYNKLNIYLSKTLFLLVITQGMIISIMPFIVDNFFLKYKGARFSLIILSLVPMLRFAPNVLGMLIVAERNFTKLIYISMISLVIEVFIDYLVIKLFPSINSISIAVFVSSFIYYVIYLLFVVRIDRSKFYSEHNKYILPFVSYLALLVIMQLFSLNIILNTIISFTLTLLLIIFGARYIFRIKRFSDIKIFIKRVL